MKKILQILSLSLFMSVMLSAKDASKEEVNHLSLATLMIYDAQYKKAQKELNQVNLKDPKIDKAKFYTTLGVLKTKQKKTLKAIAAYKKAIAATKLKKFLPPKIEIKEKYLFSIGSKKKEQPKKPLFDAKKIKQEKIEQLYMYLTQEYYRLKDYKNTLISLEGAGTKGKSRAALFTLRAECYYKLKDYSNAITALNRGIALFPNNNAKLLKQKFYYYADLKLYQAAIEAAKNYMQKVGASAKEYITLAQMLIGSGQVNVAISVLEEAKLKFPKEPKIDILLGHMYLKKEMKHTTAHLFEEASYYDKKYLKDAIELHRRSGNSVHALYLNTKNSNKIEKLKQKIAIHISAGEYRKVIGLQRALLRYKMLDDDNIRYALAYSYYMAGDYKNAELHLKFIKDNELFTKATVIRKNIEKCKNNPMECIQ